MRGLACLLRNVVIALRLQLPTYVCMCLVSVCAQGASLWRTARERAAWLRELRRAQLVAAEAAAGATDPLAGAVAATPAVEFAAAFLSCLLADRCTPLIKVRNRPAGG